MALSVPTPSSCATSAALALGIMEACVGQRARSRTHGCTAAPVITPTRQSRFAALGGDGGMAAASIRAGTNAQSRRPDPSLPRQLDNIAKVNDDASCNLNYPDGLAAFMQLYISSVNNTR